MSAINEGSAFADALQRARQIASKIKPAPGEINPAGSSIKRPLDDGESDGSSPEPKKLAAVNDPFGAQLAAIQQQRLTTPINAMALVVEEWNVPDKMVGLIIGRGGEQIGRLQAESGCKIQMAADSGGLPDRTCTLTGSRLAIEKAKDMINQIINRGAPSVPPTIDPNHVPDGHSIVEMLIPGGKVGLVIGKGGETIRNLQERAGVKMVMIQDGPSQSMSEKPLRITGEPSKCDFAKQLIMDLITEKELERGWQPNTNDYGSGGSTTQEVMVPRQAVGVVIGKQGDMIKRIQQETGAKVQFQMGKEDGPNDRVCMVTGSLQQCQNAAAFITDLIQSVMSRDQQIGRGRGRGRSFEGGPGGGNGNGGSGRGGGGGGPRGDMPEVSFTVPANKCGLVIGKGGETIRNINQQSGAHVELSRGPPPSPHEKVFVIRGNPQQIEHAQQLINERVNGQGGPSNGQSNGGGGGGYGGNQYQYQQQSPNQSYGNQNWNSNSYPSWQGQGGQTQVSQQPQTDPSAEANAAAWAAYYSSGYYPQPVQPAQQGHQQSGAPPQAAAAQSQAGAPVASGGGAGGQPDYSAAWVEYYRSMGMHREAEMIEQQARANQPQGYSQPQATGGVAPSGPQAIPSSAQPIVSSGPSTTGGGTTQSYPSGGGTTTGQQWGTTTHPQQGYSAGYNYSGFSGQQ